MVSVCCEIGLLGIVAVLVYGCKITEWSRTGARGEKQACFETAVSYHPAEAGILYFFARIFPVLMQEDRTWMTFLHLLWDVPMLLFLLLFTRLVKKDYRLFLSLLAGYLILPATSYCVLFPEKRSSIVLIGMDLFLTLLLILGRKVFVSEGRWNPEACINQKKCIDQDGNIDQEKKSQHIDCKSSDGSERFPIPDGESLQQGNCAQFALEEASRKAIGRAYKFYWPLSLLFIGLFFLLVHLDLKVFSEAGTLEVSEAAIKGNLIAAASFGVLGILLAAAFAIRSFSGKKIFMLSFGKEAAAEETEGSQRRQLNLTAEDKTGQGGANKNGQTPEAQNGTTAAGNDGQASKAQNASVVETNFEVQHMSAGETGRKTSKEQNARRPELHLLTQPVPYTVWDYAVIAAIMLLSGILIFWNLGSKEAPQTTMALNLETAGANEIVLDLGETMSLSSLQVYLGRLDNRKLSVSSWDEAVGSWNLLYENSNVSSVFCWNELEIPMTTRYLGIVAMDSECYINELVILDASGEVVKPANADVYPQLFDEQDLYPVDKTYYVETMFDEIYHARTAYEIIEGTSIYEYTHPQLGKILMGIGIRIFGMTPFGWRFICSVFGCLLMLLLYLMVRRISGKTWIAAVTDLLFFFDFMHFTLSRIGTIDIIIAFFLVAMFYSMYAVLAKVQENAPAIEAQFAEKKVPKALLWQEGWRIGVCGLMTSLAIATKWTGFYAAAGLAVEILVYLSWNYKTFSAWKEKRRHLLFLFLCCVVSFLVLPLLVYAVSFWPFLPLEEGKNIFQIAYEQSMSMYSYHSGITETHPYMSEWYEWLWDKRPLLDAFEGLTGREEYTVSSVATFGNPLVWLLGSAAAVYNAILWRVKKDRPAQLLVIAYLSMLLPWMLVHRTVFIYQYFGCVTLMPALMANALRVLDAGKRKTVKGVRIASVAFVVLAAILFAIFFPEISGAECTSVYANDVLEWLPSWVFA